MCWLIVPYFSNRAEAVNSAVAFTGEATVCKAQRKLALLCPLRLFSLAAHPPVLAGPHTHRRA